MFERFRREFLSSYFGKNAELQLFARKLIAKGKKKALLDLNKAVKALGNSAIPKRVISKLAEKHGFKYTGYLGIEEDSSAHKGSSEATDEFDYMPWVILLGLVTVVLVCVAYGITR